MDPARLLAAVGERLSKPDPGEGIETPDGPPASQAYNGKVITNFSGPGEIPFSDASTENAGGEEIQASVLASPSPSVDIINEEKCLAFESAFDFLCFFDPDINSGRVTPYPWQLEALDRFSSKNATKENPVEMAICAANGSGKDKYVIASTAMWLLTCHKRARYITTTASGGQLASQTEPYIRQLASHVNEVQGADFVKILQRHITSPATGGEIKLFATDEGAKAEGFHPWTHDSKMALVVNEAKSVLPEIFEALARCTGYTHHMMISSPGAPTGDFYKYFTGSIPWSRRVTAHECPHLNKAYIDKVATRYGRGSCLYRSMIEAEFAALDSLVAIQQDWLDFCYLNGKPSEFLTMSLGRRAGVDLSMGGDESVVSVWEGNRELALEGFRLRTAPEIAARVLTTLQRWNVPADKVNIDDGGIGRPIIDLLWEKGFNVNRVLNQSSAYDSKAFLNRGAELYFNLGRIMQSGQLVFQQDPLRARQLCNRNYKQSQALGKYCLQSKAEARAAGQPSPDRGDATVLAFAGLSSDDFGGEDSGAGKATVAQPGIVREAVRQTTELNPARQLNHKITEPDSYNDPVAAYRAMLMQQGQPLAGNRCYGSLSRLFR